jgi:hypothetical protein
MDLLSPLQPLEGIGLHRGLALLWRSLDLGGLSNFDPGNPGYTTWLLSAIGVVALVRRRSGPVGNSGVDLVLVHPGTPKPESTSTCTVVRGGTGPHLICPIGPARDVTQLPPDAFRPTATGPADGMRLATTARMPGRRSVSVRCADGRSHAYGLVPWALLTAIRTEALQPPHIDILFQQPCVQPSTDRAVQWLQAR